MVSRLQLPLQLRTKVRLVALSGGAVVALSGVGGAEGCLLYATTLRHTAGGLYTHGDK